MYYAARLPPAESTAPQTTKHWTVRGRSPHSLPNPAGPYTGCLVGAARLRPTRMSPTCLCARTRLDIVGAPGQPAAAPPRARGACRRRSNNALLAGAAGHRLQQRWTVAVHLL